MPPATRPERRRDPAAAVSFQRIVVIGGGAWGTALANAAALAGREVCSGCATRTRARSLREARENARYLPGVRLHERVAPTADLAGLADADAALLVVPAQTVRSTTQAIAGALPARAPLVVCAKGIERGTGLFLSDVAREIRPASPVAVLSGPSFADDVARGLPTAVTLACAEAATRGRARRGPLRAELPALSRHRHPRRRDRRRGEERARDRLRGGRRPRPRRERQGGAHRARLCRADALRPRLRRPSRRR